MVAVAGYVCINNETVDIGLGTGHAPEGSSYVLTYQVYGDRLTQIPFTSGCIFGKNKIAFLIWICQILYGNLDKIKDQYRQYIYLVDPKT